jgi:hypothetical protein
MWTGGEIALVRSSILPNACAAIVAGLSRESF